MKTEDYALITALFVTGVLVGYIIAGMYQTTFDKDNIPHNFSDVSYSDSRGRICGSCPICEVINCTCQNITKYVEVINESNNS